MKILGPDKCIHCGKCLPACPSYRLLLEENASPRGRNLSLAHRIETSKLELCLLCERCAKVCPQGISFPINYILYKLNNKSPNKLYTISNKLASFRNFPLHYILRKKISEKSLERVSNYYTESGDFYVYASCGLRVLYPDAFLNFMRLIGKFPVHLPKSAECCGIIHLALGDLESVKWRALRFLEVFCEEKPVIVFCATCFWMIRRVYPLLFMGDEREVTFQNLAERTYFVFDFLKKGLSIEAKMIMDDGILYHFPCHLSLPLTSEEIHLKSIIKAQDFCCGSARLFLWKEGFPRNYRKIWREKTRGKYYLLTLCTGCYLNFNLLLKEPPKIGHWMEFIR